MTTRRFEPIFDDLLRQAAGPAPYGRGVIYHAERRVDLLALDDVRALARVRGTQIYQVELRSQAGLPKRRLRLPRFRRRRLLQASGGRRPGRERGTS